MAGHRQSGPALATALLCLMVFASAIAGGCGSSTSSSVTKIDATTTTTTPTNDAPSTTTTLEPEAGRGTQFYLYTPVVGDCFDRRTIIDGKAVTGRTNPAADASLGQRDQVIIRLDCEVPHQYEVAHVDTATVSATPPQSGAAFEDLAKRICPEHFASYVGRPYQDSALEVGWFLPTPDQQAQGIEFLGCLVFNPRGKLTDTVRNSDR